MIHDAFPAKPFHCLGYRLVDGERRDRHWLTLFLRQTYGAVFPEQKDFSHLRETVEQYFCRQTPLWWVYPEDLVVNHRSPKDMAEPVAGLWLGNAIDQATGERHGQIFMVYVRPAHRRRGIATALLQQAKYWGQQRGDRRLGLQVYPQNQAAVKLYEKLGFRTTALILQHHWQ